MKFIRSIMAAFRLKKAFTLVELSVVLMVSGLLVAAGLQGAQMMSEQAKVDDTKKKLDEIETALVSFAKLYERIPCPARRDKQMGSSYTGADSATYYFGSEDCVGTTTSALTTMGDSSAASPDTVRTGVVPVTTLNLPAEYMFDGYGNRITYAMVKALATNGTAATNFGGFTTALTTGVINIVDSSGLQMTYPHIKAVVAYALVSHGKDGKGAFSRSGTQISGCSGSTGDNMNCETAANPDNTFRDMPQLDVAGASGYYDDYIRWKTLDRLKTQAGLTSIANLPTCSSSGQCLVYTTSWGCGSCSTSSSGMPSCTVAGQQPVYNGTAWVCNPEVATLAASCTNVGALARETSTGNLLVCKEGTTPIEDATCDNVGIGMISYEIDGSQYVCKNQ